MSAFRKGDTWQPDEVDALVAIIPLDSVYDLTTEDALVLLREQGEMTEAQAREALSFLRFGYRLTDWRGMRQVGFVPPPEGLRDEDATL